MFYIFYSKWKKQRLPRLRKLGILLQTHTINEFIYLTFCFRMNWTNGQWTRTRKQYCKDHDMIVCSKCYTALHSKCYCEEIIVKNDVKDCVDLVKNLLNSIIDNNKSFRVNWYTKDFNSEIKSFTDSFESIDNKVRLIFMNALNNQNNI